MTGFVSGRIRKMRKVSRSRMIVVWFPFATVGEEGEENLNDIRRKVRQIFAILKANAQEFVWRIRSCG